MFSTGLLKGISYCTTGLVLCLGYHQLSVQNKSTDILKQYPLSVPFQHLQKDKQLILFLHNIEKTLRSVDLISYVRIVSCIDKLIELKFKIQNEGGTLYDRTLAYRTIQKCKESMKRSYTQLEHSLNSVDENILYEPFHRKQNTFSPREIIYVQSIFKKIIYILDSYLKAIISLTSDGRLKR